MGAGETIQWLKALATKPDSLNPIPGTYKVGKTKPAPTSCPLPTTRMLWLPNTQAPYTVREGGREKEREGEKKGGRRKDYLEPRQALTWVIMGSHTAASFT